MKFNVISNMKVNSFLFIHVSIFICILFVPLVNASPFCDVGCAIPNSCTSQSSTACTACATSFKAAGSFPNACVFDTGLAGIALAKSTADFSLSSNPGKTCSNISYNYGEYGNNSAFNITSNTPISQSHYQVQLIVWLILFDNWSSSGYVDFKLAGSSQNFSITHTNQLTSKQYCFSPNSDGYVKFDQVYTHSDTTSNIQFLVTSIQPSSSGGFGIRDILLIISYCHSYCKTCTGPASNVCSACNTGYFLSGTTCASDCLTGYGKNLPSNVCIVCNAYCQTCDTTSTNCTVCQNIVSGTQIYKVQDQNSCLSTCSAGYYSYLSTQQCLLCSLHCVNMSISSVLASDKMSLEFIYTFSEAMNFTSFNYATFLNFSSDNASVNANTDFSVLYTVVDSTHFKLKLTPLSGKYLVNTNICTNILPQATNAYQFSLALKKLSPSVYTSSNCALWSTPQAGMSLSSQVDSSQTFGQFYFTFTDSMNLGTLVYSNFTFFNCSDSTLSMTNDFVVTYTILNATSFSLKLAPKPMKYFTDATFCAVTYPQSSTALQFSANNYKLMSSVYNAYSCITFSTPKVFMTISNQLDSNLKFLQFSYTFSAPMDFTSFVYTNFALLNQSDSAISIATNFSILYTAVNDTCFTLQLTPNLGTYFANTTFCTTSQAQNVATLQFSKDLYKLDNTVYGQSNCVVWTIPSVNMSISSSVLNLGKSSEFLFNFDAPMNFTSFSYTDFLSFALSMTQLNLTTNFTINYTQIDQYSFKLQISPIEGVSFQNLDFCVLSNLRSNTLLQLSNDNTVLNPSVYNQSNCLLWSTPLPSVFTPDQQKYYQNLSIFNNQLEQITTQKGTQQIIKSGVMGLFMPGAQLSTTVLLHQPRIAQNLYEGSRFWGSFVFFDVPPFQQNSSKTKYTFSDSDKEIIQNSKARRLQQTGSDNFISEWKFQRTGHTGFFIFDTYIQILMIGMCWILCLIVWIYKKKCQPKALTLWKLNARVMALFHKVHEVSFFYLVLSGLIQYKNLNTSTYLHTISMAVASFFLCYYLVYELKIFYDLIDYPRVKVGTREYHKFVQNYGIYLAYYRFEEYNVIIFLLKDKKVWNWRHFFRPYNYHTLTFIKKTLMLTAVPLFYDHGIWPVIILTVLQFLDVVRFLLTLPYQSNVRNFFYFFLESVLFIFFLCSFINQIAGQSIYDENGTIINVENATTYKNSGWLGMILLFVYNGLYILSNLVQFGILLFTKSSIENLTWSNRNLYYQELYQHFEQYGSYYRLVKNYTDELAYNSERREAKSFKGWVNRFHGAEPLVDLSDTKLKVFKEIYERGNLFTTQFDQKMFKDWIDVRIQTFKIKDFQRIIRLSNFHKGQFAPRHQDEFIKHQTRSSPSYKKSQQNKLETKSMKNILEYKEDDPILNFDIQYQIIPEIYIADPLKHKQTKSNVYIPKKIKNTICTYDLNPQFQSNLAQTLVSYQMPGTDEIKLSTILTISLKNYQQGQKVVYKREDMRQQIVIKRGRKTHKIDLKEVIQGFPVDWINFQKTKQMKSLRSEKKQIDNTNRNLLKIEV